MGRTVDLLLNNFSNLFSCESSQKKILKLMLRILIISLFIVGTILIFSYLTTYLVQKFGRLIAISSIISVGIILSAIIIAHEDGCVTEVEGSEAAKVCWFK